MNVLLVSAILAMFSICPAIADTANCAGQSGCRGNPLFVLSSTGPARSYGLFITAPADQPCPLVQYRVSGEGAMMIGQSPYLEPGRGALIRLTRRFDAGRHILRVRAIGCADTGVALRRVILRRPSPDHS
jgi:hypothetical protein